MSEFDELRRLRDADPVGPSTIPSSDEPGPQALRERIVMAESRSWWRSRVAAMSAAAAAVALAAGGIVLATQGTESEPTDPGPVTPPGSAMCVELYSLDSIKDREVVFDGTVKAVAGDDITFTVGTWFKGGSGSETTLKGASTLGGITSAGDPIPLDPGTRLLVAGDGGFAWGCGFTQPYSASVAEDWRAATA